jgi:hypothetical protein
MCRLFKGHNGTASTSRCTLLAQMLDPGGPLPLSLARLPRVNKRCSRRQSFCRCGVRCLLRHSTHSFGAQQQTAVDAVACAWHQSWLGTREMHYAATSVKRTCSSRSNVAALETVRPGRQPIAHRTAVAGSGRQTDGQLIHPSIRRNQQVNRSTGPGRAGATVMGLNPFAGKRTLLLRTRPAGLLCIAYR